MVRIISSLCLLASVSCTFAAPSSGSKHIRDQTGFSFTEWAKGIIADPTGDHLSPEEAVEAAQQGTGTSGDIKKRDDISCNDGLHLPASLADATSCVMALAARGSQGCHIPYGTGANLVTIGLATIHGVTVNRAGSILPCNDFALSAAHILDTCTRPGDTTIEGSNFPNDHIEIFLSRDK